MKLTLTINQLTVIDEVAKTTEYIGAKLIDTDTNAYLRISATDADAEMLQRFWQEGKENICGALRRIITYEGIEGDDYCIELWRPDSADPSLISAIESGFLSYFVQYITGSWLALVGNDKAGEYLAKSAATLADIRRKILCRRAPVRPSIIPSATADTRLRIYRDELLYDIESICYLEALSLESREADSSVPHIIYNVCGAANIDRVLRLIGSVYAHAAELLSSIGKKECITQSVDNRLLSPEFFDICLNQQCKIAASMISHLTHLVHQYIVYRVVAEWMSVPNPTASTKWGDKAALIAAEIRTSVNSISSLPRRRQSSPF